MKKLAVLNTDSICCNYGGVAPFMKNLDPFLRQAYEVTYFHLPEEKGKGLLPRRLKALVYLWQRRKELKKFDFILSHIPEGSIVASYTSVPYAHIYHGNNNPMNISRYWYGKFFTKIYDVFYKRIANTAAIEYTVGPTWGTVKKLFNPILHSVKPIPTDQRKGFIFAGRLEKGKNIDRILKIYSLLPEQLRNEHHFYIAGYGSQEENLKALTEQMGLSSWVHFLGGMSNIRLIEEDARHKILLMASDKEGLPNAIAEAFSVGIPVVSTAAGDIARVLKNDYNGFIFPLDFNDKDYEKAIINVLADYERLSKNALDSAKVFDAATVTKGLIDDINQKIGKA